jgi:hypothetical protein
MPLSSETTHRKHIIGQDPKTTQTKIYNYSVANVSKDIIRDLARNAGMNNYSNRSKEELLEFLNQQDGGIPLRNIQVKVVRARP